MIVINFLLPRVGGWSDSDNKANLSPATLRYAANEAVAQLGNKLSFFKAIFHKMMSLKLLIQCPIASLSLRSLLNQILVCNFRKRVKYLNLGRLSRAV